MNARNLAKNVATLFRHPVIVGYYVPWCLAKLGLRKSRFDILGADFGGFPNFSSYLGAARNSLTQDEIDFVAPHLKEAQVIFDVGANFGVFAIYFAKLSPHARIFAFEPHPGTARALRENVRRSGLTNIEVIEAAISDADGSLVFEDGSDPATNRIVSEEQGGLQVQSRSLASFCEERGIDQIDFMKIDVEGAEMSVLAGSGDLFKTGRIAAGMIEACPANLRHFGRSMAELAGFFDQNGFELFILGPNRGRPIDDSIASENAGFVRGQGGRS